MFLHGKYAELISLSLHYFFRYKVGSTGIGTISVGKIGQKRSLLQWTDTSDTALNATEFVGFQVESGGNTEFGTVCFDVL